MRSEEHSHIHKSTEHHHQAEHVSHHDALINASERMLREVHTFTSGGLKGAMDSAQHRLKKDPGGLVAEAGTALVFGAALGVAAEMAPVVAAGAALAATGKYIADQVDPAKHGARNKALADDFRGIQHTSDSNKLHGYEKDIAKHAGNDVLDFGIGTIFGAAGYHAGPIGARAVAPEVVQPKFNPVSGFGETRHRFPHEGTSSETMQRFTNGDHHALQKGHLNLEPNHHVRLESSTRKPFEGSKLHDFTTVERPHS